MLSHTIYSCPSVICSPAQLLILAGNTPTFNSQETCKNRCRRTYISLCLDSLAHVCVFTRHQAEDQTSSKMCGENFLILNIKKKKSCKFFMLTSIVNIYLWVFHARLLSEGKARKWISKENYQHCIDSVALKLHSFTFIQISSTFLHW